METIPLGYRISSHRLWDQVSILIQKSLSCDSLKNYHTGIRRLREFIVECNPDLSIPLRDPDWAIFYAWLMERVKPDTANNYLSHIAFMLECNGYVRPNWKALPLLARTKIGARKSIKAIRKQKQPVTYELATRIMSTIKIHPHTVTVLSGFLLFVVILLVGLAGWMRLGELLPQDPKKTHPEKIIRRGSFTFFQEAGMDTYMRLWLFRSKGDTFNEGVPLFIPANIENPTLCPVAWTRALLRVTQSPNCLPTDPVFVFPNGALVTKRNFIKWLRTRLQVLQIDPSFYSGHSLRIGAAVSAARREIAESVIQKCGRWRSDTYLRYIKYIPADMQILRNLISQMRSIRA